MHFHYCHCFHHPHHLLIIFTELMNIFPLAAKSLFYVGCEKLTGLCKMLIVDVEMSLKPNSIQ